MQAASAIDSKHGRPGYSATSLSGPVGNDDTFMINFDVVGGDSQDGVSMPLSVGPQLVPAPKTDSTHDETGRHIAPRLQSVKPVDSTRVYVALADPHERVLCDMMQDWALERDILLVGPAGCGKSQLIFELCSRLGWDSHSVKVFPLFRDVSARDILQTRTTLPSGDTAWIDSPLIQAAKAGTPVILDNMHAARPDVLLGSLERLIVDREVELPDGTLLKAARRMSPGSTDMDKAMPSHPTVMEIPRSFRILTLGTNCDIRNPVPLEAATMFSIHTLSPLSHSQMRQIAAVMFPGACTTMVDKLCNFGELLQKTVEAQKGRLSDTEVKSLQLNLRLFCRLCRFLASFPGSDKADLLSYIHDGMLTAFMPNTTRELVDQLLVDVGLSVVEERTNGLHQDVLMVSPSHVCVGGHNVKISTAERPDLIPASIDFFTNKSHDIVLRHMLQAHAAGERALLLIGSQGVGKNRLADKLISMLGREREYIQLHRDSTLSSLTLVPSLEDGQIVWTDSPLVRAAKNGRILLVDEADKAPLEVVVLLKQLAEDGNILLGNGQRLARVEYLSSNMVGP
eukprot:SAG31_NODE_5340_length_2600_cov_1.800880_1_plen_567_part_10